MNVLSVDIGNTRIKISVWNEESPLFHTVVDKLSMKLVEPLIENFRVEMVCFSQTRDTEFHFRRELKKRLKGRVISIDKDYTSFEIIPSYRYSLGTDRFAAYLGTLSLLPGKSVLIVDAGSALTTDITDSEGEFRGGNISPGVSMRFRSLHDFTAALPLVSPEGETSSFGINTETAIRNGVMNGMVAEIEYAFQRAAKTYSADNIVITGGDAELLIPLLEERGLKNIIHDPLLVERGINSYARERSGLQSEECNSACAKYQV